MRLSFVLLILVLISICPFTSSRTKSRRKALLIKDIFGDGLKTAPNTSQKESFEQKQIGVKNFENTKNTDDTSVLVKELVRTISSKYSKEAVVTTPIVIHMDVLLLQVKKTVEREGVLESVIGLMIEWYDKRMRWDPAKYHNVTFLSLNTNQVWLPDIAMANSAEHLYSISRDDRFTVRVSHNGMFKFVPTGPAKTWCNLQLITFPFDIQTCALEFESWSLNSKTMTFDGQSQLLVDGSFNSMQFELCHHHTTTYEHTYPFTGETFTRVRFVFTVKRKSTFYVMNLIFPIVLLSLIQTLTFLLPCADTSTDRLTFGTTNLLTLVVYQTIITEQLPKTSDSVTALTKYVISLIVLATIGIFESVLVLRFYRNDKTPPSDGVMAFFHILPTKIRKTPGAIAQQVSRLLANQQNWTSLKMENKGQNSPLITSADISSSESLASGLAKGQSDGRSRSTTLPSGIVNPALVRVRDEAKAHERCYRQRGRMATQSRSRSRCSPSSSPRLSKGHRLYASDHVLSVEKNAIKVVRAPLDLWIDLALKIDRVTFVGSFVGALVLPLVFFIPLLVIGNDELMCKSMTSPYY